MSTARKKQRYGFPALLSLLAHAAVLLVAASGWIPLLTPPPTVVPPQGPPPVLEMIQMEPPAPQPQARPRYLNTEGMSETEDAPKNSQFWSDKNTRFASMEQGDNDSMMPHQSGRERPGLSVVETPASRPQEQSPPEESREKAEEQQKQEEVKPQEKTQPKERSQQEFQVTTEGIQPIQKSEPKTEEKQEQQPKERKEEQQQQQQKPAAQPEAFSFKEEKTKIAGGKAAKGNASIEAAATPLGKYTAKVYKLVGSQWRLDVYKNSSILNYGSVTIKFTIRSDGTLTALEVAKQTPGSAMLKTVSENAVRLAGPFDKFPDSVRQQVGQELTLDVNFVIY